MNNRKEEIYKNIEIYISLLEKMNLDYYVYGEVNKENYSQYRQIKKFFNKSLVKNILNNLDKIDVRAINFIIDTYISNKSKRFYYIISLIENIFYITIDNRKIYFSGIDKMQSDEMRYEVREKLERFRRAILSKTYYFNYCALKIECQEYNRIFNNKKLIKKSGICEEQITKLEVEAYRFLEETDKSYKLLFSKYKKNILKIPDEQKCNSGDIAKLIRCKELDNYFPEKSLKEKLENIIQIFGKGKINNESNSYSILIEKRDNESLRPFCSLISIPETITITINMNGGLSSYLDSFHEVGHLCRYMSINTDDSIIDKRLRESSIEETHAILFENIVRDKEWYGENFGTAYDDKLIQYINFIDLLVIRRYFALFLFKRKINQLGLGRKNSYKELYFKYMERALNIEVCKQGCYRYIEIGDDNYAYILGSEFALRLKNKLQKEYGVQWYRSCNIKNYLLNIWNNKDFNTIEGFLNLFDDNDLNFVELTNKFKNIFKE